jgi:hypothetical protein
VDEGIFNVMIGDPTLGMAALNSSIFNIGTSSKLKLRIWFSDGVHGFQHLTPDKHIVNPQLIGITSPTADYTIYVNGTTGNDENSGLSPTEAKQTIQAAVNALPSISDCNVTIDIADGVYREYVTIVNKHTNQDYEITLIGDESWTPASAGDPTVRVTGRDNDVSGGRVRDYGIFINKSTNIVIKGILFDYCDYVGLQMNFGGRYSVYNCKAANNYHGFRSSHSATHLKDCLADSNDVNGIWITKGTHANIENCVAKNNSQNGVGISEIGSANFNGTGDFSNNYRGIAVSHAARAYFFDTYSGQINNNSAWGIEIRYNSYTYNHTRNSFSNNGTPPSTTYDVGTAQGSSTY